MRIVCYNIMSGGEGRADPIAEVILAQRPDIVAIIEADYLPVLERLAMRLKMDFVHAQGTSHACALLSRWTIRESINHAAIRPIGTSFLEAVVVDPSGGQWNVAVAQNADVSMAKAPHILAGDVNAASLVKENYVDTMAGGNGATFSTQNPTDRRDFILTQGVERSRIRKSWIETDRLAKYASDHFPIGAEIAGANEGVGTA